MAKQRADDLGLLKIPQLDRTALIARDNNLTQYEIKRDVGERSTATITSSSASKATHSTLLV